MKNAFGKLSTIHSDRIGEPMFQPPAASDCYVQGDKVRLLKDIWDDGCDNHHPPGYFGRKSDTVIIRDIRASLPNVVVSPENAPEGFGYIVYFDEIERA